eukprot:TRINITY_DN785_c2_g1_i1.p1 TRINITY_DN785_c2_g1~~TRINITY_DN785_c2_g1_i1.p1  ORF type:complete len:1000 (+),score=331.37 TRINITY_DN785_c2_g1_i1:89-3001(+)
MPTPLSSHWRTDAGASGNWSYGSYDVASSCAADAVGHGVYTSKLPKHQADLDALASSLLAEREKCKQLEDLQERLRAAVAPKLPPRQVTHDSEVPSTPAESSAPTTAPGTPTGPAARRGSGHSTRRGSVMRAQGPSSAQPQQQRCVSKGPAPLRHRAVSPKRRQKRAAEAHYRASTAASRRSASAAAAPAAPPTEPHELSAWSTEDQQQQPSPAAPPRLSRFAGVQRVYISPPRLRGTDPETPPPPPPPKEPPPPPPPPPPQRRQSRDSQAGRLQREADGVRADRDRLLERNSELEAMLECIAATSWCVWKEGSGRCELYAQERAARVLLGQWLRVANDEAAGRGWLAELWAGGVRSVLDSQASHQRTLDDASRERCEHDLELRHSVFLRALSMMELYHADSRRHLLDSESSHRVTLASLASKDAVCAGRLAATNAEEADGRYAVSDIEAKERRLLRGTAVAEASVWAALPQARVQIDRDERHARREVRICEGSLRQTIQHMSTRERRWALASEESDRGAVLRQDESHARGWVQQLRVHDMWVKLAARDRTYRILMDERRARAAVADAEVKHLLGVRALSLAPWQQVVVFEQEAETIIRIEQIQRRLVSDLQAWEWQGLRDDVERRLNAVSAFMLARAQLPVHEDRYRSQLIESQLHTRYALYSHSIEISYFGVRQQVGEEAGFERMMLLKQWQLFCGVLLEHERGMEGACADEEAARGSVAAAEAESWDQVMELHGLYMQRFSAEHMKRILTSKEGGERRRVEWDEVALRNAVQQYRVECLREAAAGRKVASGVHRMAEKEFGFSPLPPCGSVSPQRAARPSAFSPSPVVPLEQSGDVAHYAEMVGRLSEVRDALRGHIDRQAETEYRRQREASTQALRTLRQLWQRYDGAVPGPAPEPVAEQWDTFRQRVEQILRIGALSVDDEGMLEDMATTMCHALGERAGDAAGRLSRVHAFLRLLSSLRILGRS